MMRVQDILVCFGTVFRFVSEGEQHTTALQLSREMRRFLTRDMAMRLQINTKIYARQVSELSLGCPHYPQVCFETCET